MMKKSANKLVALCLLVILSAGCGINRQAQQIKALEDCKFRIVGAQQILVAGTDVKKLLNQRTIDLSSLPGIALGLLSKNVPLNANINLEITNPQQTVAAINQFEYKLLIGDKEVADGTVDNQISIGPGQKVTVPVQVNSNIYNLLSNSEVLDGVIRAIKQRKNTESLGALTIKLKPTFMLGKSSFKYPGYITITKEINAGMFL